MIASKKNLVVLGLDPGYGRCGWAIVSGGITASVIAYGCIETPKNEPLASRLLLLANAVRVLIKKHAPTHVVIEELFFAKNVKTAIPVAEARGVLLLIAAEAHLSALSLKPAQVKMTITGSGNAPKEQVQRMVRMQTTIKERIKSDDAADAVAIALTGAYLIQSPLYRA